MPKYRLLAPGPVPVPERVLQAMARPVLHHRAPEFIPVFEAVRADLKRVFQTREEVLILSSSGTGAMEAAVSNFVSPGDCPVVVRGGKFGERWAELCAAYGADAHCVDVEWGRPVSPDAVREAFAQVPEARCLFVQASETSTGVYHPIRELAELVHEAPDRLIVVDGISAVGVHDLQTDAWGLDVLVSGSQKSFMLPPGLAFVALSERARAQIGRASGPRYYFDLRRELEAQPRNQTAFTPAISLLSGLRESLAMILADGMEVAFERHTMLAAATRAAAAALGLELYAPVSPSHACTAIRVPEGLDGQALVKRLRDAYGFTIAGGQGRAAGKIFRIGHIGDVDSFDTIAVIAALEMALSDLGFPAKTGEGTRAATELLRDFPHREG
ncbi:MAG: alanine--glyoxylate aminotransferase family protein [Myxococcota bacterium]|nr:alanine--glyoxylate aminotransferase family protein [Myxococcota bacterium]